MGAFPATETCAAKRRLPKICSWYGGTTHGTHPAGVTRYTEYSARVVARKSVVIRVDYLGGFTRNYLSTFFWVSHISVKFRGSVYQLIRRGKNRPCVF